MDGAPAHFGRQVRAWMNVNYSERWIGWLIQIDQPEVGRGPVARPPRSPDITPLNFHAWGYLKDIVYETTMETREELSTLLLLFYDTFTAAATKEMSTSPACVYCPQRQSYFWCVYKINEY
ncbi:hypothetical protein NQ318_001523 [Aromia moschata]|uniref:Uncharacterized protein n=1 Tax=Aromia moschata TaxID=1265417 RepID=A0AAV8X5U6_9CUCU|nr:hypothetical protein NQ318_001523 [Aromia moschata]